MSRARDTPFDEVRRRAVEEYAGRHPQLRAAGAAYVALITEVLDDAGINYLSVTGRVKSVQSFAGKAVRPGTDGAPMYADPLGEITDAIGVRVITYVAADVDAVAELLGEELLVDADRDLGEQTEREGRFGYRSRHLLVRTRPEDADAVPPVLLGQQASVQLRTVLQHAWAEFEHDIRYKGTVPESYARELDRRFTLAAGLLELADREFSEIRDRMQAGADSRVLSSSVTDDLRDPRIGPQDLAAFLAGWFPAAGWSRTDHYTWISSLVLESGIASLEELEDVLAEVDSDAVIAAMDYRYPPGAVRRLDDALLTHFGQAYVDLRGNDHRRDLLTRRLAKIRAGAPGDQR
ncbi:hypothetical protein GCM10011519_21040 [Marmoricola endophyticus]|uniref:RelA/SpoT domain-containing protein n=1 Tax=Marmoricola endophyticus TaxID=2040280 RepID=A0A917BK54_9ACTN|nr:(p)ppGpp synthetase [Marmoricola endophyticus]GGF46823.1 hypothetical protein GCM10011519_21040 [Marmoricola endophyticus]